MSEESFSTDWPTFVEIFSTEVFMLLEMLSVAAASSVPTLLTIPERLSCTEFTTSFRFFVTTWKRRSISLLFSSPASATEPCISSVIESRRLMKASRLAINTLRVAFKIKAANRPQRLVPKIPFIPWNKSWMVSSVACVVELSIAPPAVATEYMRPKNVPIRPRRITEPLALRGMEMDEPVESTSKATGESRRTFLLNKRSAKRIRAATTPSPLAEYIRRRSHSSMISLSLDICLSFLSAKACSTMNTAKIAIMIIHPKSGAPK